MRRGREIGTLLSRCQNLSDRCCVQGVDENPGFLHDCSIPAILLLRLNQNDELSHPFLAKTILKYILSSKSLKRFLVNFHTKKPMIPMTAMPPATDMPMMGPIPRPLLSSCLSPVLVADSELLVDVEDRVSVTVT